MADKSGSERTPMVLVNKRHVEVLKVWYSVYTTLLDAYRDKEYTMAEFVSKLETMDRKLRAEVPIEELKAN